MSQQPTEHLQPTNTEQANAQKNTETEEEKYFSIEGHCYRNCIGLDLCSRRNSRSGIVGLWGEK
jgi:hypothetical protein